MKIGIILDNLAASQLAYYTIKEVNKFLEETVDNDIILFYENLQKICLTPKCCIMQLHECYGFSGIVLATTLRQAAKLTTFPSPIKKYYYVWDLDWIRPHTNKEFINLYNIYHHPELKFIARSKDHADILKKSWNIKVEGITDNMNMKEVIKCLN